MLKRIVDIADGMAGIVTEVSEDSEAGANAGNAKKNRQRKLAVEYAFSLRGNINDQTGD